MLQSQVLPETGGAYNSFPIFDEFDFPNVVVTPVTVDRETTTLDILSRASTLAHGAMEPGFASLLRSKDKVKVYVPGDGQCALSSFYETCWGSTTTANTFRLATDYSTALICVEHDLAIPSAEVDWKLQQRCQAMPIRANPVPTRANPCPPRANPMPSHANLLQPRANPVPSHATPCQPHAKPCQTVPNPCHPRANPCQPVPTRAHPVPTPCQAMPTRSNPVPTPCQAMPPRAKFVPSRARAKSVHLL